MWMGLLWLGCAVETPAPAARKGARRHVPRAEAPAREEAEDDEAPAGGGDRPPVIERFNVKPGNPTVLSTITATVEAHDPDGNEVEIEYRWEANGARVAEARGPTLEVADFPRDTVITLAVSARDGTSETTRESGPMVVRNAPPQFTTQPDQVKRLDGFRLLAEDPDGDPITWSVEGGPPALTIDQRGVLHWKGSEDDAGGKFTVKVKAADPLGDAGTLELPLDVAAGKKTAPAGPAPAPVDNPG